MRLIYIPIFIFVFLVGYLIGCYRSSKPDGTLFTGYDDDGKGWVGVKFYDPNEVFSKEQVCLDVKHYDNLRGNYKSFSEKEDSK